MLVYEQRRVALVRDSSSYAAAEAAILGDRLIAQNEYEQAIHAFSVAMKADPGNPFLIMGAADAHVLFGERERGSELYREALVLVPGMAWVHNGLGISASNLDRAEGHFRRATEFDPSRALYRANLAGALYHLGLRSEAVATFMQIVKECPTDLGYAQALASILAEDRHMREAEYCLRTALDSRNDAGETDDQAWYMYRLRAFDQAEKLFRETSGYDFDLAATYALHGRLALAAELVPQAVVSLKRAVSLSPRSERFHRDLADAMDADGQSFVADAARTRAGQMRRARKRSTDQIALWAESEIKKGQFPIPAALARRAA